MSGLGRYIVDAVVLEHRSPTQLARDHGISKRWVFELLRRFKDGGYPALEPRSRRPKSCPHQVEAPVRELIVKLRGELSAAGYDAGPETIAHHLIGEVEAVPSVATIWRILKGNRLITPQPHKRPKSSFIRFEATLPNETWQLDSTPWQLADNSSVEILNFLDDKSRLALASKALVTVKSADPVHVLHSALGFKESMQHPSLRRLLHAITGPEQAAPVLDSNQGWPGLLRSGRGSRRAEAHGGGLVRAGWRHHATQRPSTVQPALPVTRGTRGHPRRD